MALLDNWVDTRFRQRPEYMLLGASLVVILMALGFEYFGGYRPCELCGLQRYAYYAAIPIIAAAIVVRQRLDPWLWATVFYAVAMVFGANALLAVYHTGVEWHWWAGPVSCTGGLAKLTSDPSALLANATSQPTVRCDQASWRLAGLSFAGWNVVISAALAWLATVCANKHA